MSAIKFHLKLLLAIQNQFGKVQIHKGCLLIETQVKLKLNMMESIKSNLGVCKQLSLLQDSTMCQKVKLPSPIIRFIQMADN